MKSGAAKLPMLHPTKISDVANVLVRGLVMSPEVLKIYGNTHDPGMPESIRLASARGKLFAANPISRSESAKIAIPRYSSFLPRSLFIIPNTNPATIPRMGISDSRKLALKSSPRMLAAMDGKRTLMAKEFNTRRMAKPIRTYTKGFILSLVDSVPFVESSRGRVLVSGTVNQKKIIRGNAKK